MMTIKNEIVLNKARAIHGESHDSDQFAPITRDFSFDITEMLNKILGNSESEKNLILVRKCANIFLKIC